MRKWKITFETGSMLIVRADNIDAARIRVSQIMRLQRNKPEIFSIVIVDE